MNMIVGNYPLGFAVKYKAGAAASTDVKYGEQLSKVKLKGGKFFSADNIVGMNGLYEEQYEENLSIDEFCEVLENLDESIVFVKSNSGEQPILPDQFFKLVEEATSLMVRLIEASIDICEAFIGYATNQNRFLVDNSKTPLKISVKSMPAVAITPQSNNQPSKKKYVNIVSRLWIFFRPITFIVLCVTICLFKNALELDAFASQWSFFPCIFCFIIGYLNRAILKPDPFYLPLKMKPPSTLWNSRDLQNHLLSIGVAFAMLFCSISGPYLQYYIMYYVGLNITVESVASPYRAKTADDIMKMSKEEFLKYSRESLGLKFKEYF